MMDLLNVLNTLSSNNASLNGTQMNLMNTTLIPTTPVYDEITEDDGPSAEEDSVHAILMHYIEYRISRYVGIYGYPLVTFLGTVGNVLSFLVMKRKSMRNNSTCFFMSVLAVADTVVLYFGCLRRWVTYQYNWDIINYSSAGCKIFSILNYWGFDFAVWILVAMTIDRFIALRWPLKSIIYATVSRAKKTSILIALILLPVNVHFLWTVDLSEDDNCQPKDDIYRHFIENEWVWIDATLYSFVPFFLLLVFNVLIIFDNRKALARQRILKGMAMRNDASKNKHIAMGNQRLTKMLLAVSATFLVMSAPKVILLIIRPHVFIFADENGINWIAFANYTLTAALLNILTYGSHAINFFLYCITGQKFRRELKTCMCCKRKRWKRPKKISTIKTEDDDHIGAASSSTITTHL